jgi:1-deoxy-D-xylulose-5-phosphate reductoisomerase
MRIPIGYALAYPDRLTGSAPPDSLEAVGGRLGDRAVSLAFERPDGERFPCLDLAYEAARRGGTAPARLSAANEVAVHAFLEGALPFHGIAEVVAACLGAVPAPALTPDTMWAADAEARSDARREVGRRSGGSAKRSAAEAV